MTLLIAVPSYLCHCIESDDKSVEGNDGNHLGGKLSSMDCDCDNENKLPSASSEQSPTKHSPLQEKLQSCAICSIKPLPSQSRLPPEKQSTKDHCTQQTATLSQVKIKKQQFSTVTMLTQPPATLPLLLQRKQCGMGLSNRPRATLSLSLLTKQSLDLNTQPPPSLSLLSHDKSGTVLSTKLPATQVSLLSHSKKSGSVTVLNTQPPDTCTVSPPKEKQSGNLFSTTQLPATASLCSKEERFKHSTNTVKSQVKKTGIKKERMDDNMYHCNLCNKKYTHYASLYKHKRSVHKEAAAGHITFRN